MKNKAILIAVITLIAGGVIGFLGGMQFQKSQQSQMFPGAIQARQGGAGDNFRLGQNNRNGFTPVNGEIIDSDSKSITVKLSDGSSKIVLLSDTTSISKSDKGSVADLKKGQKVAAFGTQNSDGSISAQNIQLDPVTRTMQPSPDTKTN